VLVASGDRLYWIGLGQPNPGRIRRVWPQGAESLGYGRGVLAGDCILWPTREKIYVSDQQTGRLRREIALLPRGLTGGNLLVAGDQLLIATGDELVALGQGDNVPVAPQFGRWRMTPPDVADLRSDDWSEDELRSSNCKLKIAN
jgi:hypothetical protein